MRKRSCFYQGEICIMDETSGRKETGTSSDQSLDGTRETGTSSDQFLDGTRAKPVRTETEFDLIVKKIEALLKDGVTNQTVFVDDTILRTADGNYVERRDFDFTEVTLGGGNSSDRTRTPVAQGKKEDDAVKLERGDSEDKEHAPSSTKKTVRVIEDLRTSEKYVMKSIKTRVVGIEITAMLDLRHTEFIPKLHAIRKENDEVQLIMQYLDEDKARTMSSMKKGIKTMHTKDEDLALLFPLCVLLRLLECIKTMHDQNVTHRDLHPGNILLVIVDIVFIVDFGEALPLIEQDKLQSDRLKRDVLAAALMYIFLMTGQGSIFTDHSGLKGKIEQDKLEEILKKYGWNLTENQKTLIKKLSDASDPTKEGYEGIGSVTVFIQTMLSEEENIDDIVGEAIPYFFNVQEDVGGTDSMSEGAEAGTEREQVVDTDNTASRDMSSTFAAMGISETTNVQEDVGGSDSMSEGAEAGTEREQVVDTDNAASRDMSSTFAAMGVSETKKVKQGRDQNLH